MALVFAGHVKVTNKLYVPFAKGIKSVYRVGEQEDTLAKTAKGMVSVLNATMVGTYVMNVMEKER